MNAEIIAVGTEILLGDITNTHARYLAKELAALGINLLHQSVVGDNRDRLAAALQEALERSSLVILTGGLGPTNDDLTKETICQVMGMELQLDQEALQRIKEYFAKTGREMPDINIKQAMVPLGGTVFYNDYGTAPGAAIEKDGKCVIMLPGPPRELLPMFEGQVRPFLGKYADGVLVSHTLSATGIGESAIAERIGELLEQENPTVALYAKDGEVQIRVTAKARDKEAAESLSAPTIAEITRQLGDFVYGLDAPNLHSVVVDLLQEQKLMIATAESCTGGMLSQRLTEISGASEVFEFGVASYSNRIKEKVLGIPKEILDKCGAVSSEVAMLMAAGAQREGNADLGVGITGIAGPGGGTPETPVGRVFVAVTYKNKYWVERLTIGHGGADERDYIRSIATLHALNMVRLVLEGSPRAVRALSPLPAFAVAPVRAAAVELDAPVGAVAASVEENPDTNAETAIKAPWYQRLAKYLFPWKGDAPSEIVRKVVFLVALVTLVGSSIYIIDYIAAHVRSDIVHNETIDLYTTPPTAEELKQMPEGYLEKFAKLYNKNQDIKGWIKIGNSRVNHPVVMTDNNEFYLDHDFDKNVNRYGVPFIDYRSQFGRNEDGTTKLSTNTILYGHNGANGKIFCDVKNYTSLGFYRGAPLIDFDTVYEEADWKVFAVFLTNGINDGDGYFFDYHNFVEAQSEEHFDWFIRQVRKRSMLHIPNDVVDVKYGDQLLTLSTCSRKADLKDGRIVVVARKVRPGEAAAVSTGKVTTNENPLYPNAWYKQHGKPVPEVEYDPNPLHDADSSQSSSDSTSSKNQSSVRPDDPGYVIPSQRPSSKPSSQASSAGSSQTSSGVTSSTGSSSQNTTTSAAPPSASSSEESKPPTESSGISSTEPKPEPKPPAESSNVSSAESKPEPESSKAPEPGPDQPPAE